MTQDDRNRADARFNKAARAASDAQSGKTARDAALKAVTDNMAKLKALPAAVHDFIFYHECAHARIPTTDELQANCGGLKDMRDAGRAGPAVEDRLQAFFSAGNLYWANTVRCANRPLAPANPPGSVILKPPG